MNRSCRLLCSMVLLGSTATVRAQEAGHDAVHRRHPPQDQALHEKFYSTWHMPDNPSVSCCNSADCYPTDIKYIDDQIYARRRGGQEIHSDSTAKGGAKQGQSGRPKPSLRSATHTVAAG